MFAFKTLIATIAVAASCLATATAEATTIDFNGTGILQSWFPTALSANGFTFTSADLSDTIGTGFVNATDTSIYAYDGTGYYISLADFTIKSANASAFSVAALNLASWVDNTGVTQATLTGTFVGGGAITKTVILDTHTNVSKHSGNDFTTFDLSGFTGLSSLTISHTGEAYLALDNLVISAASATSVPEPSSIALFGLALAAGAVVRRRRA